MDRGANDLFGGGGVGEKPKPNKEPKKIKDRNGTLFGREHWLLVFAFALALEVLVILFLLNHDDDRCTGIVREKYVVY